MFDVDEDGKPDILSGAGDLMTYNETLFCMESNDDVTAGQFSHFHDLCKDFSENRRYRLRLYLMCC